MENELTGQAGSSDAPTMTIQDGHSTVVIGIYFKANGTESLDDKLKRMICADIEAFNY